MADAEAAPVEPAEPVELAGDDSEPLPVSVQAENALDEALAKGDPFSDTDTDEDKAEQEEEEAAAAAEDDDEEESKPAAKKAAREDEEEDEEPEPDEDEEDEEAQLEHAYEVLLKARRAPFSVLKSTPKAKLIAWAETVEAEQKDGGEPSSTETQADGAKETGAPAQAGAAIDWASISKGIADELGVDASSAERAFKPVGDALVRHVQAALAPLREQAEAAKAQAGRAAISSNVRRLKDSYDQLKTAKNQEKLTEKAHKLLKTADPGEFPDHETLFDAAADRLWGAPKRRDLAQKRRNGVSTPAQLAGGYGAPAANEDEDFMRRMDLVEGGHFEQARALPPPRRSQKPGR